MSYGGRVALLICAFALGSSAVAEENVDPTPETGFTPAKPIDRPNPAFPREAQEFAHEGWVEVTFCIDATGAAVDPVIDASSGPRDFERATSAALKRWKYAPAALDGRAIETCMLQVLFNFSLNPVERVARPEFIAQWNAIGRLIKEGKLDEAQSRLDNLQALNNYESAHAMLRNAEIWRARGDARAELSDLRGALLLIDAIEPPLVASVRTRAFALQAKLGLFAEAMSMYAKLVSDKKSPPSDSVRAVGQALLDAVHGAAPIATPLELDDRVGPDGDASYTSLALLRRAFEFADVGSGLERFELRCSARWFRSPIAIEKTWNVPESWGACRLYLFGTAGATLKVIEYARSDATPAPDRPAIARPESTNGG